MTMLASRAWFGPLPFDAPRGFAQGQSSSAMDRIRRLRRGKSQPLQFLDGLIDAMPGGKQAVNRRGQTIGHRLC